MKRTLKEFGRLTPAERQLRDTLHLGHRVVIGDGERPGPEAGEDRQVRAEFLRYLILGGCAALPGPVPESGVWLQGARITGQLDLEGARIPRDIILVNCRFDAAPIFRSAALETLNLHGSALPGLLGDRLSARGNVMLRKAEVTDELCLPGATLGGDLDCDAAQLTAGESGNALLADGLDATGDVSLDGLVSEGAVRLLGAKVGGDLDCDNAQMTAGNSVNALIAVGARIDGTFFLRSKAVLHGVLDLAGAVIGHICDDPVCWPKGQGELVMNRCRYGAFLGTGPPVDAQTRIRWLSLQDEARWGQDFWPQPWEHCAKVLREMGHQADARAILIEKEKRQRAARRARLRDQAKSVDAAWLGFWDWLLGVTVRYGRQPLRAFLWLFIFWGLGCGIYWKAGHEDAIKPNNAFVLRSAEWAYCAPGYQTQSADEKLASRNQDETQRACFERQAEALSYPRFNPLIYSADTLLPIVHLEMQEYWIPNETAASPWGQGARIFLWAQIALGWALSLLAVAGFSGLVKTDSGT